MPKTVDATQRRHELAEAVWRVVRRDGLESASVRAVAREAGTSMGALRHWLPSQDDLLRAALELVAIRVADRLTRVDRNGPPREVAEALLAEVLPLDADRLAESRVWYVLTARSLVVPALAELRDRAYDGLRQLCASAIAALQPGTSTPSAVEVERLYALLDGLAVHAVLRPQDTTPDVMRMVLRAHLESLHRPG